MPATPGVPKYQAIASDLAQAIVTGQLVAGEKLPPHRVLARRLGVTTGTVSRAYASLEKQALALARVGDGTYVRNLDGSALDAVQAARFIDMGNNVAIATDDVAALQRALAVLAQSPTALAEALKYQPEAGAQRHRAAGAAWLERFGTAGDGTRVMVTHGAQHAIAGVLRTLARPGDSVLTEMLSYPGLLALGHAMRLQVIGVEMDGEGLLPDALERAAQTFGSRLLFCSPSLHNPLACTMSMGRREAIAAVARRHNLLLIEDVVHAAALEQPPPAISTLIPEQSFLVASFSKVMAPGLRIGYLEAAPRWLDKVAASIRTDCWMVAPLMAEIAMQWIHSGEAERLIALQRAAIAQRRALALEVLDGITLHSAVDFPHLWLPLPAPWRAGTYAAALRQAGVLVRGPDHFAAGRAPTPHAVRISLNKPATSELLHEGLIKVVQTLRQSPGRSMAP